MAYSRWSFYGLALLGAVAGCFLPGYTADQQGGTAGATGTGGGATTGTGGSTAIGTGGSGGVLDQCPGDSTCIPARPTGWSYVRTSEGAYDSTEAPCPDGNPPLVYFKNPAPAQCTSCNCAWSGEQCTGPQISCYSGNTTCGGAPYFTFTPPSSACVGPGTIPLNPMAVGSCRITAPPTVLSQGTCSGGSASLTNPAPWLNEVHTCGVVEHQADSCDAGELCVSNGSVSYPDSVCLMTPGDQACPMGWDATRQVVYTSGVDGRGCGSCTCDAASATTLCGTPGTVNVFDDDICAGSAAGFSGANCGNVGARLSDATRSIKPPIISASTTGGCSGGGASGQVMPSGPMTICCM